MAAGALAGTDSTAAGYTHSYGLACRALFSRIVILLAPFTAPDRGHELINAESGFHVRHYRLGLILRPFWLPCPRAWGLSRLAPVCGAGTVTVNGQVGITYGSWSLVLSPVTSLYRRHTALTARLTHGPRLCLSQRRPSRRL